MSSFSLSHDPSELCETPDITEKTTEAKEDLGVSLFPAGALLVDTVELCLAVSLALRSERVVAVDAEGVRLGRNGRMCVLQIATRAPLTVTVSQTVTPHSESENVEKRDSPSERETVTRTHSTHIQHTHTTHTTHTQTHTARVFLFDVTLLQHNAFAPAPNGSLATHVLSNASVVKLLYDLRKDSQALFHSFGVTLRSALDLQILVYHTFHHRPPQKQNGSGRGRGRGGGGGRGSGRHTHTTHTTRPHNSPSHTTQTLLTTETHIHITHDTLSDTPPPHNTSSDTQPHLTHAQPTTTHTHTHKPSQRRLTGYAGALQRLRNRYEPGTVESERFAEMESVKARGFALFASTHEVWEQRPLHPVLVEYCVGDVCALFDMYDTWFTGFSPKKLKEYSETRQRRTLESESDWPVGDDRWKLPDWL